MTRARSTPSCSATLSAGFKWQVKRGRNRIGRCEICVHVVCVCVWFSGFWFYLQGSGHSHKIICPHWPSERLVRVCMYMYVWVWECGLWCMWVGARCWCVLHVSHSICYTQSITCTCRCIFIHNMCVEYIHVYKCTVHCVLCRGVHLDSVQSPMVLAQQRTERIQSVSAIHSVHSVDTYMYIIV